MKLLRVMVLCVAGVLASGLAVASPSLAVASPVGAPATGAELDHIALQVRDLGKSEAFYEKVVGLERIPEPFHDGLHVWMKLGPHLALHLIGGATTVTEHPIALHFCVHVTSLEGFMASMDEAHIPYRNMKGDGKIASRPDGVRQIYIQDPDGYWIEVNDAKY